MSDWAATMNTLSAVEGLDVCAFWPSTLVFINDNFTDDYAWRHHF